MKAAAETVLEEDRLPRHSQQYRDAYRPAYRVLREKHMKDLLANLF